MHQAGHRKTFSCQYPHHRSLSLPPPPPSCSIISIIMMLLPYFSLSTSSIISHNHHHSSTSPSVTITTITILFTTFEPRATFFSSTQSLFISSRYCREAVPPAHEVKIGLSQARCHTSQPLFCPDFLSSPVASLTWPSSLLS